MPAFGTLRRVSGCVPEGDTVFRAARTMNRALAGKVITRSDFRVPQLATADISGQTVTEVVPVGKHLLVRTDAEMTLRTHFKMEGAWRLFRPGQKWRGPAHEIRLVLETAEWVAVGYLLAMVDLVPTSREDGLIGHLGPDILASNWDIDEVLSRMNSDPEMEIAEALLDQTKVAGIGNIYKNETLFLKGLDPWMRVSDVPDLKGVLRLARKLMMLNTEHPEQATTGNTTKGRQWWVMERPGHPCRRCGALVEVGRHGPHRRLTYWCPHCQPRQASGGSRVRQSPKVG